MVWPGLPGACQGVETAVEGFGVGYEQGTSVHGSDGARERELAVPGVQGFNWDRGLLFVGRLLSERIVRAKRELCER